MKRLGGGPETVARAIERAISARNPKTRYKVTASARLALAQRKLLTDRAWDAVMRSQFPSPKAGRYRSRAEPRALLACAAALALAGLRGHRGAGRHPGHDLAHPRAGPPRPGARVRPPARSRRCGWSTRRCSPTATRTTSGGAELIPGLASDLPEVSADGRTYTLALREGLTYSDGTPGARLGLRARDRARARASLARRPACYRRIAGDRDRRRELGGSRSSSAHADRELRRRAGAPLRGAGARAGRRSAT